MAHYIYYPQTYPNARFDNIKACRAFMNSGLVPFWNFESVIGCFIVRFDQRTGTYALFEHRFPSQKKLYKKYCTRYKKTPADCNRVNIPHL